MLISALWKLYNAINISDLFSFLVITLSFLLPSYPYVNCLSLSMSHGSEWLTAQICALFRQIVYWSFERRSRRESSAAWRNNWLHQFRWRRREEVWIMSRCSLGGSGCFIGSRLRSAGQSYGAACWYWFVLLNLQTTDTGHSPSHASPGMGLLMVTRL